MRARLEAAQTRVVVLAGCVLFAAAHCEASQAQAPATVGPHDRAATIGSRVEKYLDGASADSRKRYPEDGGLSGVILVAVDGKVAFARGYGYGNREWSAPATTDTKFRLFSITKILTAMAIMQLQERGKLNIDDSIAKYLDRCPAEWRAITIRHLLTHRSGLPDFSAQGQALLDKHSGAHRLYVSPDERFEQERNKPLKFTPGAKFSYNNFGFFVAGLIIEKVTGKPYEDALREQIFQPAGMLNTGLDRPETILVKRASYYYRPPSPTGASVGQVVSAKTLPPLENADFTDVPSMYFSAGALYSTVLDLLKFDESLYSVALVSQKTLHEMWAPSYVNDDGSAYGIGWEIDRFAGHRCFWHMGAGGSANTVFMHFPDDHVLIVVLANSLAMGSVFHQLPLIVFGATESHATN